MKPSNASRRIKIFYVLFWLCFYWRLLNMSHFSFLMTWWCRLILYTVKIFSLWRWLLNRFLIMRLFLLRNNIL